MNNEENNLLIDLYTKENGSLIVKYDDFCKENNVYSDFIKLDSNVVHKVRDFETSKVMTTAIASLCNLHKAIIEFLRNNVVVFGTERLYTENDYIELLKKNADVFNPYIRLLEIHYHYKIDS